MTGPAKQTGFRWKLAEADSEGTLFPDETAITRHVGTGEYQGMEFLQVNARSIMNEVPAASFVPFRYTINAYRGCINGCVYCISGESLSSWVTAPPSQHHARDNDDLQPHVERHPSRRGQVVAEQLRLL